MTAELLHAALACAQRGWPVLPLNGKAPLTPHGYKDGSTDPEQIRRWWHEHPDAWIGVVVGPESGLCVLDVDPRSGGDRSLAGLIEKHGPLPETPKVSTAGGGLHYYFTYHEAATRSTIAPGLEIKARDGYVVAPPSRNCATDSAYAWATADGLPFADLPTWLLGRPPIIARDPSAAFSAAGPIPEGERNSTLASLAGSLRKRGASEDAILACLLAENRARCVPPLPGDEVDRIARSIARYPAGAFAAASAGVPRWPDPLDEAAFQGLAGEFVRAVGPHTEADPVALLTQLLCGVGNLVGRGPHFAVEADRHYTNEFVVLVGESSKARKGTAAGHVRRLLRFLDPEWADFRQQSGLSSGEGLIWAVRDPIMARSAIREKGRVKGYEDVEEDPGISDKRLLILEPEFASTLRVIGREGSTLSPVVRQAWDTGNLRVLTKKSQAIATGALISIVSHVTRDELRRYLDRTEAGNGFANRFMWFCVRRSKVLPRGGRLRDSALEPFLERLRRAVEAARARGEVKCDDGAWALWEEVYEALSEGKPGLLGAVTSRAEPHVMRLALIYALLDEAQAIGRHHLEAALALWRFSEASARYIFGDAIGDPAADELLAALRARPTGLTRTEINTVVFGRNRAGADIARAIDALCAHGLIGCRREETAGRPAERWHAVRASMGLAPGASGSNAPPPAPVDPPAPPIPPSEPPSSNSFLSSSGTDHTGPAEAEGATGGDVPSSSSSISSSATESGDRAASTGSPPEQIPLGDLLSSGSFPSSPPQKPKRRAAADDEVTWTA